MKEQNDTMHGKVSMPDLSVSFTPINQATAATFADLYFSRTFLFLIRSGSKKVLCHHNGVLIGEPGDLLIFPPGSVVTLENRPIVNGGYHADSLCFTDDLVSAVFAGQPGRTSFPGIQVLRETSHRPSTVISLIKETLDNESLPPLIKHHRLLEPLIWLRHNGVQLVTHIEDQPLSKVRRLIETDLSTSWRSADVARHFAMSEATFRRWLAKAGLGFGQVLLNTRLERGLNLLQTTDAPISQIALQCGFKTPSHFSDSFRKRFKIAPKLIRSPEK